MSRIGIAILQLQDTLYAQSFRECFVHSIMIYLIFALDIFNEVSEEKELIERHLNFLHLAVLELQEKEKENETQIGTRKLAVVRIMIAVMCGVTWYSNQLTN